MLRSVALPLVRPALLTAMLLTFIGPWNEFLWPFLITKKPTCSRWPSRWPTTSPPSRRPPPTRSASILAGACVLAAPAVGLFIVFQRHFVSATSVPA